MRNIRPRSRNPAAMRNTLNSRRTVASKFPRLATGRTCVLLRSMSAKRCKRRCAESRRRTPETLYAIFGDAQWTNKNWLSDSLLRDLIEHFSRINLGNQVARSRDAIFRLLREIKEIVKIRQRWVGTRFHGLIFIGVGNVCLATTAQINSALYYLSAFSPHRMFRSDYSRPLFAK